ncbi:histidine phosphatase family protein [Ramlibacter henchirensis]|uniref:Histidine phosphatase family protein n=1 Tax=Ramlibacter henchirensis TaxID=204072 RepID=A0A4Z0BKS9_9BURK|nr:histidine phosphatase family protein [Ramlibacter henchirensis]TFY99400.1 histidine phosphatase family protein [Ramlibacter henchirensis]
MRPLARLLFATWLCFVAMASLAADAWTELAKPGAIVLFRHATAPGVGDPQNFRLDDCSTQRNLNEQGRAESRRLGEQFRQRGVAIGAVLSSQWCRTRETARLAFGDRVRDEPAFNSFFGRAADDRSAQTERARRILREWKGPGVLVVVTHQVNITGLTDHGAMSAEGVVVEPTAKGPFRVVANLQP